MGTSYSNIFERFAIKVQDYTLDKLYASSVTAWEDYLLGFLKSGIAKFIPKCKQDLTNRTDASKTFGITLTEIEEEILAGLMEIEWMEKETKNIRDMRLALNDTGAMRRYAESANLSAKEDSLINLKERVDKMIVEYSYYTWDFYSYF